MINPESLPNIVPVNKNKLQDVKKLLQKHFGSEWADALSLVFYKELFETQVTLAAPAGPENENRLCTEAVIENVQLRI